MAPAKLAGGLSCLGIAVIVAASSFPSSIRAAAPEESTPPLPGTQPAAAAPALQIPARHLALRNIESVRLEWETPTGATGHNIQVTALEADAAGYDLLLNDSAFTFASPTMGAGPYQMLPDALYAWRVRSRLSASEDSWTQWSEVRTFSTPRATSKTISPSEPAHNAEASGLTPSLVWKDTEPGIFMYELQLSEDAGFESRAVYTNKVHGGATQPLRSWQVPEAVALEHEHRYYWRVRPVVQTDVPVEWSETFAFQTPAPPPPPEPEPEPEAEPVWVPAPAARAATTGQRSYAPAPAVVQAAATAPALGGVLGAINQVRQSNGLTPLAANGALAAAAQGHSNDMAARNSMSHTGSNGSSPAQRISAAGYAWRMYGEVVAAGQTSAQAVVTAWMNSPAHRDVILTPGLREFGTGVAYGAGGRPYWTVNFGTR